MKKFRVVTKYEVLINVDLNAQNYVEAEATARNSIESKLSRFADDFAVVVCRADEIEEEYEHPEDR